jgi:hypothetical protein
LSFCHRQIRLWRKRLQTQFSRLRRRRELRKLKYLGILFLLPLVVGIQGSNKDSSETNIKLAGGTGSYAYITRGCEGQVLTKNKIPFNDLGFSLDHKFASPVRVGLRGGNIWERNRYSFEGIDSPSEKITNFYINPDLSLEWKWFSIGAGLFSAEKDLYWRDMGSARKLPSGHLRLGSPQLYLSAHLLESVPLYSGGGYLNLGFGGEASRRVSFWLGLGVTGPYDIGGFLIKTNIKVKGNWRLDLAGRLGSSEGISENAFSFGLNYRFITK